VAVPGRNKHSLKALLLARPVPLRETCVHD
jgi:hypothetical protein